MRIVFIGAGAVGGYFGARMVQAGLDVSFLLRPESARALRRIGLRLRSPLGDYTCPQPKVLEAGAAQAPADLVFVACKAEGVRAAAESASSLVGRRTLVVPLQNGVDAPGTLAAVLGPESVVGGLSRIFAERVAPGSILHMGAKPSIALGEREGGGSARVQAAVASLAGVEGLRIEASDDIWTDMWKKLLMVCSIGAVGAAARAPLGVLLGVSETRGLLLAAGAEIARVARAHGAQVPSAYAEQQAALYERLPAETTASMHRDLERGDPSELDAQLGAACRYGRQADVATPVLDALHGALLPRELRSRGHLRFEDVPPRVARKPAA